MKELGKLNDQDEQNVKNYLDPGEKIVIGDLHGSLLGMLMPLIYSGIAEFDKKKLVADYDTLKNERVKPGTELDPEYKRQYIIMIPNLKLASNKNSIIFLGDVIDRGQFSDEVFFMLIDLLNQQQALGWKDTIIYLAGNHEIDAAKNLDYRKILGIEMSDLHENIHLTLRKYFKDGLIKSAFFDEKLGYMFAHSFISEKLLWDIALRELPISVAADYFFSDIKLIEKNKYMKYLKELEVYFNYILMQLNFDDNLFSNFGIFWARPPEKIKLIIKAFVGHNSNHSGKPRREFGTHFFDTDICNKGPLFGILKNNNDVIFYDYNNQGEFLGKNRIAPSYDKDTSIQTIFSNKNTKFEFEANDYKFVIEHLKDSYNLEIFCKKSKTYEKIISMNLCYGEHFAVKFLMIENFIDPLVLNRFFKKFEPNKFNLTFRENCVDLFISDNVFKNFKLIMDSTERTFTRAALYA